jgi:multiple sugar transport system substrate-binding protein
MTSPDYDVEDFPEGFRVVALYPPGADDAELYGIPITFEAYILFYNRELVDKYLDGEVPQTMDELVAASQKVAAEGGGEDFGTVLRGNRDTITTDFVSALVVNCLGGDPTPLPYNMYFDGDWAKPRFTEPLVEEGFNQYATLMQTGPPGILAMDWYEASTSFQQGHVAFFIDASLFSPGFENPDESAIAGKVGYMPIPVCGDNAESYTTNWMWGLGIPANSENKDAAWYFIQWVTSKEMEAKLGVATGGAGRVSTWSDPDYVASLNPDYVVAVEEAMQTSRPAVVFSEYWAEVALGITDSVHAIYEGEDAAEVLQAQQDFTLEIVQQ